MAVVQRKRSDGSVGYHMRWRQGGRWQSDIFDTDGRPVPGAAEDVGDDRVIGDQPGRNDRIHRFRSSAESHDRVSRGGRRQKVHAEPIQTVPALFVAWAFLWCGCTGGGALVSYCPAVTTPRPALSCVSW
jgi:hypothetical protein